MDPEHNNDWEATLPVALGTRHQNEAQVLELARKNLERNPGLRAIMEGIVCHYWPTLRLLAAETRNSLIIRTQLLFEPDLGEGQFKLAGMAISASLESELRATVFEPFKQLHGKVRGGPEVRSAPSAPRDALAKFVEGRLKGQITLGPMIGCLVRIANPSEVFRASW